MKVTEDDFGVERDISRTTVRIGTTVNMDGTSVYPVMHRLF